MPTIPVGKTLVIPLACDDADGDTLTYTVTSNNARVFARVKTGNPHVKMTVHSDNGGDGQPIDGQMEFQLFRDFTPETASFIAGYAQSGYYDNVIFHRIIPDFVIQGGDPAGTGSGQTGGTPSVNLNLNYQLPHEFRPELIFSGRGQLAMANSSGGYSQQFKANGNIRYQTGTFTPTNGTQFFITLDPLRAFGQSAVNLDYKHTIFGQLIRGFDVMDKVAAVPTNGSDKPDVEVKMTALTVAPSKTDGILLLSATAPGTAAITVTAKDPEGNTATRIINVTVVADTVNDPPILDPFEPVVMPVGGVPNFRLRSIDLESDAVSTRFPVKDVFTGQTIYAGLNSDNLQAVARPAAGAWDVAISVAGLNDPLTTSSPFDASRFQQLEIGVGDRAIVATPVDLEPTAGISTGTVRVATFRHGGVSAGASDFVATVIWGDGSNSETSTGSAPPVAVIRSPVNPSFYEVRAMHTYARPGVYPVHVIIDGPSGSTDTTKGLAVVTAAGTTLKAIGQQLTFTTSPLFAGRPVAIFKDSTPGAKIAHFTATIDWGDGLRAPGVIRQTATGTFAVFGTHRYLDPGRYAVAVHVHRASPAADAIAWSSIKISGFPGPSQMPPFAKASITSYWSENPTKFYRAGAVDIFGTLFIINGGQKPTTNWKIRMWLSNDATLNTTGANADTQLKVGPLTKLLTEIPLNALTPGSGGNFGFRNNGPNADFTIRLPAGETAAGKYIIAQLAYSDPITDHMAVKKNIAFGPLNGVLVTSAQFISGTVLSIKEGGTNPAQRTASFNVRLDTLPTGDVTIPIEIVNSQGIVDNSRATLNKSSLTFSNLSGTVDQVVTVTSVDDTANNGTGSFTIRLKPATSTDPRFQGMDGRDVSLQVVNDDQ